MVTKGDVTMSTGFAGPPLTLWVYGDERGDDPMRKWEPHDSIYVWKKTFSIIYTIKIENKKNISYKNQIHLTHHAGPTC